MKKKGKYIMCSTPSMPSVSTQKTETIATPTVADAAVTKSATAIRNKTATNAGRDIRTAARGLSENAQTQKKKLLGE